MTLVPSIFLRHTSHDLFCFSTYDFTWATINGCV
jgi:hypothetical protein